MASTEAQSPIIALVGIDGSGKTTQAHRLVDWLSETGVDAAYHRCTGGRRRLDRLARRLGKRDIGDLVGHEIACYLQAVVRWTSMRLAVVKMGRAGVFWVMDRYAPCQYAAVGMQGLPMQSMRSLFGRFPAADIYFFLDIDPAEAVDRVDRRGIDSDSVELLRALDKSYRALPEFHDFVTIDAAQPPEQVQQSLRFHLGRMFPTLRRLT